MKIFPKKQGASKTDACHAAGVTYLRPRGGPSKCYGSEERVREGGRVQKGRAFKFLGKGKN